MFFWKKKLDQNSTVPAQPAAEAVLEVPTTPAVAAPVQSEPTSISTQASATPIQPAATTQTSTAPSQPAVTNPKNIQAKLAGISKKVFTKKNILYSVGAIAVLGMAYFGFRFWQNRTGTLTISDVNTASLSVSVNNEFYTEFPITIRLKPGTYSIISSATGRLPNTSEVTVKAFSNTAHSPELKNATAIGFINQDGYAGAAISSDGKTLRYFDKDSTTFIEVTLKPTAPEIADNTKYISEPIDIDTTSKYFEVKWSKDTAFLTDGTKSYFFTPSNGKAETVASAFRSIDFIDDTVSIGLFTDGANNTIYKFTIGKDAKEKLFDVTADATKCYLSPDKLKIAIAGDTTIIYDLKSGKILKRIDKKAATFIWNDGQSFAASFENDSVYSVNTGSLADDPTEIAMSFYSQIILSEGKVYYSFLNDDGTNSLIAYSISDKTKAEIEKTDLETPIALAGDDKSILFIGNKNYEPESAIMLVPND
jgi:hypothetical protein